MKETVIVCPTVSAGVTLLHRYKGFFINDSILCDSECLTLNPIIAKAAVSFTELKAEPFLIMDAKMCYIL